MILTPRGGRTGPEAVGKISTQRRKGEVVGYSVYLGVDADGAKRRRFFADREAAEGFVAEREQSPLPFGELWERRMELLYTLDRMVRITSRPSGFALQIVEILWIHLP